MKREEKSLSEITDTALKILYKNIGTINTIRFINQFTKGYGNYTEERHRMFKNKKLKDIIQEIKIIKKL